MNTLNRSGVERAFGVSGGAIALLFDALQESIVELGHFRHETGAAFAAAEAYFARYAVRSDDFAALSVPTTIIVMGRNFSIQRISGNWNNTTIAALRLKM